MQRSVLIGAGISIILISAILFVFFSSTTPLDECSFLDEQGVVQRYANTCSYDIDCGESGFYGEVYCRAGALYQGYYAVRCEGVVGTCESKCVSKQEERLIKECENGCLTGQCR
ncbi:MAG: hypothetical protein ACMXYD_04255 [Candidatus Woesearchaeota archaeon]